MKTPVDGMAMIVPLFTQAEAVQAGRAVDARQIGEVFAAWVEKAPAAD
jgi:hypothetical protein